MTLHPIALGLAPGEVEIAEMPGALLDILLKPEPKPPVGGGKGGVKEGGRNNALTREAGRLRACGPAVPTRTRSARPSSPATARSCRRSTSRRRTRS